MAHDSLLARGDRAFVDEDFDAAVTLYSEALKADPNSARLFESRAHAHIKLDNFMEAAEDASKAIQLDPTSVKAYLRKGMACFNLEEYESAKEAFEAGLRLAPDNTQFKTWMRKCQAEIDEEQGGPEANKPTPTTQATSAPTTSQQQQQQVKPSPPADSVQQPAFPPPAAAPLAPAAAPSVFEGKYRHQWYQLQNKVTVDVYAKNIAKERVECTFQDTHLTFIIRDDQGAEDYKLDVELYGKVDPSASKCDVLRSKIEITMLKADMRQWGSLEKSSQVAAPNYSTPGTSAPAQYPSSYAKKPKNWSEVESEIKELEQKGELEDGDPLNNFFKKIFAQGDENQRRAMMKSFVESNGTVLSTNWDEVGKEKVVCKPPEGMEVKKYSDV